MQGIDPDAADENDENDVEDVDGDTEEAELMWRRSQYPLILWKCSRTQMSQVHNTISFPLYKV